jgi:hypothetical protein
MSMHSTQEAEGEEETEAAVVSAVEHNPPKPRRDFLLELKDESSCGRGLATHTA